MSISVLKDQQNSNDFYVSQRVVEETEFENKFRFLLDGFVSVIDNSKETMLGELKGRNPNQITHLSKPIRVNENIRGALFLAYPDMMHVVNVNTFAYINDGYAFVFKKLSKRGKPSGILTRTLKRQLLQGVLDFPGFNVKKKIYIGYVIQNSWEEESDIYAVTIKDYAIDWKVDLRQNYSGGHRSIIDLFNPVSPINLNTEIIVKLKTSKKL